jgi:hypothetical protein
MGDKTAIALSLFVFQDHSVPVFAKLFLPFSVWNRGVARYGVLNKASFESSLILFVLQKQSKISY